MGILSKLKKMQAKEQLRTKHKFSYLPCGCGGIHKLAILQDKDSGALCIKAFELDKSDIPAIQEILSMDNSMVQQLESRLSQLHKALEDVEAKRAFLSTPAKKDFIN